MKYTFDPSQMAFLRLLSDRARQNITYHCRNSAAWFNKENSDYTHSIKIMGDNGIELHASSSNKFKPTILRDDCHVSLNFVSLCVTFFFLFYYLFIFASIFVILFFLLFPDPCASPSFCIFKTTA
jgi:hypothetical protein